MRDRYKSPPIHIVSHSASGDPILVGSEYSVDGPLDLLGVLLIIMRRRKKILILTLAAAILATLIVIVTPNMYTATTSILPPQQNESSANVLVGQIGMLSGLSASDLGLKNPSDIFIGVLKSRSIQDALIDQFDLRRVYWVKRYEDARRRLNQNSEILAEKEGLISISVSDRDPHRAADLANAYVDQLRLLNQNLAVSEATQRRLFYEQKLAAERNDLASAELSLKQAEDKTGLIQPDVQSRAIIDAIADTRAKVGIQEVKLQAMRTYATPNNPDLKRAEEELAGMRGQLAQLERSTGELGNGNPEIPTRRLPEAQLDYLRRTRDLKYHEALYDFLSKQLEAARIDEAKQAVLIQVVDKAIAPEKKSAPHRVLAVML